LRWSWHGSVWSTAGPGATRSRTRSGRGARILTLSPLPWPILVVRGVLTNEQAGTLEAEASMVTKSGRYVEVRRDGSWVGRILVEAGIARPEHRFPVASDFAKALEAFMAKSVAEPVAARPVERRRNPRELGSPITRGLQPFESATHVRRPKAVTLGGSFVPPRASSGRL
jgi:hypothetical protein